MMSKISWLQSMPPRRRKMLFWCAGILTFYTITGFLIAPPIVRSVASAQLGKFLDREVVIAKVKLNPYSMSGTVEGFLIKE